MQCTRVASSLWRPASPSLTNLRTKAYGGATQVLKEGKKQQLGEVGVTWVISVINFSCAEHFDLLSSQSPPVRLITVRHHGRRTLLRTA